MQYVIWKKKNYTRLNTDKDGTKFGVSGLFKKKK